MGARARLFAHVDMNAFFAGVEQQAHPEWRGRPVIVCGGLGARGVVTSASYEARPTGVNAGMPVAQARRLCPDGIFVAADHQNYGAVSRRLFAIFEEFTPLVEPSSIDEAFLDITGCDHLFGGVEGLARALKRRVREAEGLTCSVGVAPSRILAKLASDLEKPDGLVILGPGDLERRVWPLPVGRLPGVGPRTEAALREVGVTTVGELAAGADELLRARLGASGPALAAAARGEGEGLMWGEGPPETRSLSRETTFERDVADREALEAALLELADEVAGRLRRHGSLARTVGVKLRFPDFVTITRAMTLREPTDVAEEIFTRARELLTRHLPRGRALRLLGITCSGLVESGRRPLPLFDPWEKQRRAAAAVDRVREKYGAGAVFRARLLGSAPEKGAGRRRKGGGPAPKS